MQCPRCHALGHIKTSRACQLGKDSAKCYICGGAHQSETHDRKCLENIRSQASATAATLSASNCNKTGHDCRDTLAALRGTSSAPAQIAKHADLGKIVTTRTGPLEGEPSTTPAHPTLIELDDDGDLYLSALASPNPTRAREVADCSATPSRHRQHLRALSREYLHPLKSPRE